MRKIIPMAYFDDCIRSFKSEEERQEFITTIHQKTCYRIKPFDAHMEYQIENGEVIVEKFYIYHIRHLMT
jgi:hypothetical protein